MLNVGKACDLIELLCQNVDPKFSGNKELIRDLLNIKLREFCDRTGIIESKSSISSVASTQEYELPTDCLHVTQVIYDDYKARKISHAQVKELEGKT
jgi:hypothetical protein